MLGNNLCFCFGEKCREIGNLKKMWVCQLGAFLWGGENEDYGGMNLELKNVGARIFLGILQSASEKSF